MKKVFLIILVVVFISFIGSLTPTRNVNFENKPCLEPNDGYEFTLCNHLIANLNDSIVVVPKGFKTDLASIPQFLWSIHAPNEARTIAPAILHDYLYSYPADLSRKEIDDIFHSALIDERVNPIKALEFWLAVRLFGKSNFHKGKYRYDESIQD